MQIVAPIYKIRNRISSTFSSSDNRDLFIYFLEGEWENKNIGIIESLYQNWEQKLYQERLFNTELLNEEVKVKIISDFAKKLVENMADLDPAITKIVDDNFWDLL